MVSNHPVLGMKLFMVGAAVVGAFLGGVVGSACSSEAGPVVGLMLDCDASRVQLRASNGLDDSNDLRLYLFPSTSSGFPGVALSTAKDAVFFSDCEVTFASGGVDEILGEEVGPQQKLDAAAGERDGRTVGLILCSHLDSARTGGSVDGALLSSEATLDASYAADDNGSVLSVELQAGPNPAFAAELRYSGCEFTGSMERRVAR